MSVRWFDNHCHLHGEDGVPGLVSEANRAGVAGLVTVGTSTERSVAGLDLARSLDGVWATAGVHPHDATEGTEALVSLVLDRRADSALVAVGECGLDYHYDHSPRPVQREAFRRQIALALEVDLPLVVHTRDAWEDTFEDLDREGVPPRTVFHCFTGGPGEAERALEIGAYLSVSGIVTFSSATLLRATVAAAPLERLMVETDAPYLAPVPHRGRRNRPALVTRVGEEVAALLERSVEDVAEATTANALAFYGVALP